MKKSLLIVIMAILSLFLVSCDEDTKETIEEFIEDYDEIGVYINNIALKGSSAVDSFIKNSNGEIVIDSEITVSANLTSLKENIESKLVQNSCLTSTEITDGTLTATFDFTNCTVSNTEVSLSGEAVVSITIDNRTVKTLFTFSNLSIDGSDPVSGSVEVTTSSLSAYSIDMTLTDSDKTIKFKGTISATTTQAEITGTGEYINALTYTVVVTNLIWVYGDCYPSSGSITMSTNRLSETLVFNSNTPQTGEVTVQNGRKSETKELLSYGNCPPSK
ncbi:hypothetical protein JXR93_09515 [bacterium]|nr:hypothetical protein [bacterium]